MRMVSMMRQVTSRSRIVQFWIAAMGMMVMLGSTGVGATPPKVAAQSTAIALKADGSLWGWGLNPYGAAGNGTKNVITVPTQVGTDKTWVDIDEGSRHSVAIKADGSLWTWGGNDIAQLGDGGLSDAVFPKQIGTGFKAVSTGKGFYPFTIAVKANGTLWGWGANKYQQGFATTSDCGDGVFSTIPCAKIPVQIGTDSDWMAISAGGKHVLALKTDGSLWAWGDNSNGQLGDGTYTGTNTPKQIGTGYVAIAAGGVWSFAMKQGGALWGWGGNSFGQLGDGTSSVSPTPKELGTGFSAISTAITSSDGSGFAAGLKQDGSIWTWGHNFDGQLGDGTTTNNNVARQVPGTSGFVSVFAGSRTIHAFKSDGSLWAWGSNANGLIGAANDVTRSLQPVEMAGFSVSATTTTTTTTTTTVQGTTTSTVASSMAIGWNLVGNGSSGTIDVATAFGNANNVTTVWKWIASTAKWAFYAPSQTDGGAAYASSKGYDFLTTINGGEGYWVNAKAIFPTPGASGNPVTAVSFQTPLTGTGTLIQGWNLIAIGENKTPSDFNKALSSTPPAQGVIPTNLTTLWAWDAGQSKWYFYAPSLEAQGATKLSDYAVSKDYLDFTTTAKTLGPSVGFWVNKP